MALTRALIRTEVEQRLGDVANAIWSDPELNGFIDYAIRGLYPTFYQQKVATTVAGAGPVQSAPAGARNLTGVGLQRTGATRVRPIRGWTEGTGEAIVPKLGIAGETLVWSWTQGWDAPAADGDALTFPTEAAEIVVLRSQLGAMEKLLSDRVSAEKYLSAQVRQGATEDDIALSIDALHSSLRERLERAVPLPEVHR